MLNKSFALACLCAVASHAFGQTKLPIQTDPLNPIKPFQTSKVGKASIIDTRRFSPQIGPSFGRTRKSHENIWAPAWSEVPSEPNTLPVGDIIAADRVTPQGLWPAIGPTGWFPPDPTLAVGPNHVIVTVNSTLAFFTKGGAMQFSQDAGTFFAGIKQTTFQFDPRVIFDRMAQRWVIIYDERATSPQISRILVAVSDDADPNGSWFRYSVDAKRTVGSTAYWLDYPGFGYGKDGYVVSGNLFSFSGSSFGGIEFIVLPKAPLLVGGAFTASYLTDPNAGSAQIADNIDPSGTQIFGLARLNSTNLRVYAIGSAAGTPVLNFTNIAIPSAPAPTTDAPSSPGLLDTIDGRFFSAVWRSGHAFASHTISVGGVNTVRWYDVQLNNYPSGTPSLAQSGNLTPPSGPHFHMPAIAANGYRDVATIFTRSATSGVGAPADAMAAGRKLGDPTGTMGTPFLLTGSAGSTYGSSGTNRWGDYFAAVVDPVDDATFWGVAMVGTASGNWQTVVHSWTVTPPAALSSNSIPGTIVGGSSSSGTVTLDSPAPEFGYVVTLSSSNPSIASVPTTVTVPGGQTSATYPITTQPVGSDTTVQITASLRGATKQATTIVLASAALSGTVTLGDYSGSVAGKQVTIEIRNPGSSTPLETVTVTLDSGGNYSIPTTRNGVYDLAFKASHWLRKAVANVSFGASGASGVQATLVNGDVNGDNSVTLADFALLRTAFGSTSASGNWNPEADLNGDGSVSLADFAILRAHFGAAGDN